MNSDSYKQMLFPLLETLLEGAKWKLQQENDYSHAPNQQNSGLKQKRLMFYLDRVEAFS